MSVSEGYKFCRNMGARNAWAKPVMLTAALLAGSLLNSIAPLEAHTINQMVTADAYRNTSQALVKLYRLEQGTGHMVDGEYKQAADLLSQSVEDDPVNLVVVYNLGYSYYELALQADNPQEALSLLNNAEAAFQRAQSLNPELDLVYFKLGKLALIKGDQEQAAHYYRLGLEYSPENPALTFNLARIYDQLQDYDQAVLYYEKAVMLDPDFKYAYNNLGLIYEMQGEKEAAERVYKTALEKDPAYNYARLNLGNLYADQDRLTEASALYKEALRLEPDNGYAHLYLGNVYFMQADFEQAVRHYRLSAEYQPQNASTYYLLAIALSRLERADEALEAGLQYMALDPDGRFAGEIRGLILSLRAQLSRNIPRIRE